MDAAPALTLAQLLHRRKVHIESGTKIDVQSCDFDLVRCGQT
jgi:hypothetical protein